MCNVTDIVFFSFSVYVQVPEDVEPREVQMTTVTEGVEVYMDGYQELHVELPFNVDGREHDAEYIESTRTIKYRAPYLPYEELLRRHRENPPLELGSVEGLSMDFLDLDYEYKPKDAKDLPETLEIPMYDLS